MTTMSVVATLESQVTATPTVALVYMSGRNCSPYLAAAIESVARQSHQHVHLLFVDDASTDDTGAQALAALQSLMPGRFTFRRNVAPLGKAGNAATHLRDIAPTATFIAVLDADDQLADDCILATLAQRYTLGFDVVWTNYITDDNRYGGNRALNAYSSPRTQGWVSSHLFSFRSLLWERVPDCYLQDEEGKWISSACDFAIAYPVLDQTRRYCFLPKIGYRYTAGNPASHHNMGSAGPTELSSREQARNARKVLAREPLPCWRFPEEVPGVLHEVLVERMGAQEGRVGALQAAVRELQSSVARVPYLIEARRRLIHDEKIPSAWLDAVGGWSLDVELLAAIASTLDLYAAPHVLEFGSGAGTRVLAALVKRRGGRLATIEHDQAWGQRTSQQLDEAGLTETAAVYLCPLVPCDTFGVAGRFYDMSSLHDNDPFDVVVIDGPPEVTNRFARLPALPAVSTRLNQAGFHVFLDDYQREDEKMIVEVWREVAPELSYETLMYAKGVAVVRSPDSPPVPAFG
jgi:predicted O-methyltransferase YrrM